MKPKNKPTNLIRLPNDVLQKARKMAGRVRIGVMDVPTMNTRRDQAELRQQTLTSIDVYQSTLKAEGR